MALKLEGGYNITLDEGGTVEGKLIDDGGALYKIELTWSPNIQNLTPTDGIKVRKCQDALRDIAIQLALITDIENQ